MAKNRQHKVIQSITKTLLSKFSDQSIKAKLILGIDWPEDYERVLSVPEK